MTTTDDLSSGASGKGRQSGGKTPAQPAEPPAIHMTMPKQTHVRLTESGTSTLGDPQERVEALLRKLLARLDENDRRYSQAIDNLDNCLKTLSGEAHSTGTSCSTGPATTLDRVREQASSLAAQVQDASSAHRAQKPTALHEIEQRLNTLSGHLEEGLPPGAGAGLNDGFADVTERLERSLATRAPGNEFDMLARRMDELARHFDTALATRDEPDTLQAIEAQLNNLTTAFSNAQQHYARIETIEGHLLSLMSWAQSTNALGDGGDTQQRLDAIEYALQALNDNAREMDAPPPAYTQEAMNNTPDSLAACIESSDSPADNVEPVLLEAGASELPQAGSQQHGDEDYAEVLIEDKGRQGDAEAEPRTTRTRPAAASDELGASIPDYQPAPVIPGEPGRPESGGATATRRAQKRNRVERGFDADGDLVASARRAAAAAAAAQAPGSGKARSRVGKARAFLNDAAHSFPSEDKRPRPVFVAAAVCLLLISAGILLVRLKTRPDTPAFGTLQQEAPIPPEAAPKTPADGNQRSSLSATGTGKKKQHSERMLTRQQRPSGANRPAPLDTSSDAPATRPNNSAPAPLQLTELNAQPQQAVSTATVLASIAPKAAPERLPGVQISITEPSGRTHAPLAGATPPTAAPALVPPSASTPRPTLLPLPKRVNAPSKAGNPAQAKTSPSDSAPANENSLPLPSRQTAMPPARIGPQSLRMAAARGNPAAQTEVASRFAKGAGVTRNLKKAAEWYGRAAAQGFAPAQYRLATLHERGMGVKKDIGLARTWYRRAAELGNIGAMHNLAVLYTRTGGNGPDYMTAKNWFHEAARHGLADSQFNLGVLYESGLGVRKNAAEAYKWFTLAARQGDTEARKRRELIRPKLPARSLSAVKQTLKRWKPAKVNQAANKTGQPRGGWQNAKVPEPSSVSGPELIAQVQYLLNKIGYDAGLPDGKLGPKTIAAIRRFEDRTGTPKSGKVTPALLRRLEALSS